MGGVGDEPALRGERAVQAFQQRVDRVGEVFQLVTGAVDGEPLVQAVGGDPPRGRGHYPQRAQHPARDQPARCHRHHRHHAQRDRRPEQVLV